MNTNSMSGTTLSDDDESLLPSLDGLSIQDENELNEGNDANVKERPWIQILMKQDDSSQVLMTNNGRNFDNVPGELPKFHQLPESQQLPISQQPYQPRQHRQSQQSRQLLQLPQPGQPNNKALMPIPRRQRKPKSVDKAIVQMLMEIQTIPEGSKTIQFTIDTENIVYVNGKRSPYSPVYYRAPFTISNQTYTSVDDAYQVSKLYDLCGEIYAQEYLQKRTIADKRAYVRECTKFAGLSKDEIINWRINSGLDVVFNATVQKFIQNQELLEMMKKDKDKLIINTYGNDPIDGCGSQENVEMWIKNAKGTTCVMPCEINPTNLTNFPTIGGGKNIQGVMVMLARYSIASNYNW